jgi:hypothetical protein
MDAMSENLRRKTDAELIAMVQELAVQLDLIGKEQGRRIASNRHQKDTAQDAEENEGGISPPLSPTV